MYRNIESLCCVTGTNIVLWVDCVISFMTDRQTDMSLFTSDGKQVCFLLKKEEPQPHQRLCYLMCPM